MVLFNTPQDMLPIGSSAPGFNLPGADGKDYTLESFADKEVLVVVITCNHCPYAQGYWPKLIQLQTDYAAQGVQFVAINPNDAENYPEDSFVAMKAFVPEWNINFPYLHDETQDIAKVYTAVCTPDIFVFDKERKLQYRGKVDDTDPTSDQTATEEWLRDALDKVLTGEPVETAFRPVIGCSIKWKAGNGPQ